MSQQPPWERYSGQDHFPPHVQSHVPHYRGQPYYTQPQVPPQWQEPQYQPPRKRRWPAITGLALGGVALLAASAGATVILLHHHTAAAKPLTCKQQYTAWKNGPANAPGKQLVSTLGAVQTAGRNEDIKVALSGIRQLGPAATALEPYPMPSCADPKGYWKQILAEMKAAADNAGSASGLGGLLLAEGPLKKVQPLETRLTAELARTAGYKAS